MVILRNMFVIGTDSFLVRSDRYSVGFDVMLVDGDRLLRWSLAGLSLLGTLQIASGEGNRLGD